MQMKHLFIGALNLSVKEITMKVSSVSSLCVGHNIVIVQIDMDLTVSAT